MKEPNPLRDKAHDITMALIKTGLIKHSAYTAASRLIRSHLRELAAENKKEAPAL